MFIQSGAVRLAVQDYGGAGPFLLLLHGVGQSCADWIPIASRLCASSRVVAMDLRGHGLSESGEWTIDVVLADIHTVLLNYRVTAPTIVGHSLGGVLAFLYSKRFGGVRAVIDLDGFALRKSEYVGITETEAEALQKRTRDGWDRPRPRVSKAVVLERENRLVSKYGLSQAASSSMVRRSLAPVDNEHFEPRVEPATLAAIRSFFESFLDHGDFFDTVRSCNTRSLIFRATRLDIRSLPEWHRKLLEAYVRGVEFQTGALNNQSNIKVVSRESSHMMMLEEPAEIAFEIERYLSVLDGSSA
jgi:pimeloyl-ACP methyl ester carboxylesterase